MSDRLFGINNLLEVTLDDFGYLNSWEPDWVEDDTFENLNTGDLGGPFATEPGIDGDTAIERKAELGILRTWIIPGYDSDDKPYVLYDSVDDKDVTWPDGDYLDSDAQVGDTFTSHPKLSDHEGAALFKKYHNDGRGTDRIRLAFEVLAAEVTTSGVSPVPTFKKAKNLQGETPVFGAVEGTAATSKVAVSTTKTTY